MQLKSDIDKFSPQEMFSQQMVSKYVTYVKYNSQ